MNDAFKCPITHAIMLDPVINSAGITYERFALAEWFRKNNKDPATQCTVDNKTLIPNVALRSQIDDYVKREGVPADWVAYAETLQNVDSLVKLARLGVVSQKSYATVRSVYLQKKWDWDKAQRSYLRAARRLSMLEKRVAESHKVVREVTGSLRSVGFEAAKAGVPISQLAGLDGA